MNLYQLDEKLSDIYFSIKNQGDLPRWIENDLYNLISKIESYNLDIMEEDEEILDLEEDGDEILEIE